MLLGAIDGQQGTLRFRMTHAGDSVEKDQDIATDSFVVFETADGVKPMVAVGEGGTVLTSPDGVTWTSQSSGTTERLKGVANDGAQWVAVGGSGTILTSTDAVTWMPQNQRHQ